MTQLVIVTGLWTLALFIFGYLVFKRTKDYIDKTTQKDLAAVPVKTDTTQEDLAAKEAKAREDFEKSRKEESEKAQAAQDVENKRLLSLEGETVLMRFKLVSKETKTVRFVRKNELIKNCWVGCFGAEAPYRINWFDGFDITVDRVVSEDPMVLAEREIHESFGRGYFIDSTGHKYPACNVLKAWTEKKKGKKK